MRYNAIFQFTYLRVDEPLRVLVLVLRVGLAAGVRVVLAVPEVRTRVVVCD